ncbi:hypothetical protein L249_4492 [Ophiocordyceps polyrhachis-furcata BCC 54312]|uniref:Uncharacterized protein n=1 Tax=Ophiocordyceps polyrhachis-furcata BCC 54312 TaxID=1330021 RepID=A0A367KYV0_9HYPO|nr:hypothetical protein L249_4492 [Ophiocordyceps polyrhachis-furcata BCC 54312]
MLPRIDRCQDATSYWCGTARRGTVRRCGTARAAGVARHGTAGGPDGASRVHAAAAGVATSSHVEGTAATGSRVRQAAAAGVAPHFFQQGSKRVINHACSTFFSGTLRGLLVPPKNTEGATRCRAFINQLLLWIVVFLQSRSPPAQHYHHYSSTPSSARVFRDTISYNGKFIRKFLLCSEL